MRATAVAHPNIALVKYWGKRDHALNLPAAGSFSATIEPFRSCTTVRWRVGAHDVFVLNGVEQPPGAWTGVPEVLDLIRAGRPDLGCAEVVSDNDFPTAAGLASSSSGFAALALAASRAAGLELPAAALSALARRGSGSAARSVYGGYVEMERGARADGSDAVAAPAFAADHWALDVVIAVTHEGAKEVASRDGMNHTQATSPYYAAWLDTVAAAVAEARGAIEARDLTRLAVCAEASALQMHASAIAAVPGILYWRGATIEALTAIRRLRVHDGVPVFFTVDAGPHVKAFCLPEASNMVAGALERVPGVLRVLRGRVGGTPRVD